MGSRLLNLCVIKYLVMHLYQEVCETCSPKSDSVWGKKMDRSDWKVFLEFELHIALYFAKIENHI